MMISGNQNDLRRAGNWKTSSARSAIVNPMLTFSINVNRFDKNSGGSNATMSAIVKSMARLGASLGLSPSRENASISCAVAGTHAWRCAFVLAFCS
jgi:hypothetical protein